MSLKLRRNKLLYSLIVGLCDNQINALLPTKLIDKLKKKSVTKSADLLCLLLSADFVCLYVVNHLV